MNPKGSGWYGGENLVTADWDFTENGGDAGAVTLFEVTGHVLAKVFGVVETPVTGGAGFTFEVGIAGNTAALIAQTDGTLLLEDTLWQDAAPDANPGAIDETARAFVIAGGEDVIQTIATDAATAGRIHYVCLWKALSEGASVVEYTP